MTMDTLKKEKRLRDRATWAPQPKQEIALSRTEFEIGFGGARGGGKSDAGIAWTGYDSEEPRLHGLVIRKNSIDLGDWLLRAKEIYPKIKITGSSPVIKFPGKDGSEAGGATYFTGHLKDRESYSKYVGQNLARILFEELNLVPSEEQYLKVISSCRSTIPGIRAQIFATFNPDNVGHTWIKKRFALGGIPTEPVITKYERTGRMRIFVPARVEDNTFLVDNDPDYVRFLEGLPDGIREQWRWGSWDDPIIRGAYYTTELAQVRKAGRLCDLPVFPDVDVHTWWDIGADTTAILFVQFIDSWIHIVDFYMNDSLGFPFYLSKLQEFREQRGYRYGVHHFPHDFANFEWGSGRTRTEVAEKAQLDFEIIPRVKEKQESIDASRLLFPRIKIDQHRCAQLIDALINYRKEYDEAKQTYRDHPVHDWASHPADAFQGLAMSNHDALVPEKRTTELPSAKLAKEFKEERRGFISPEFGGSRGDEPSVRPSPFHNE